MIDEFGRWVALGLVNLTNVLDPEVFVLGGGLAAGRRPVPAVRSRTWFGELIYRPTCAQHPRVAFAHWNERAGAVGAALLHQLDD